MPGQFGRRLNRHKSALLSVLVTAREEAGLTQRELAARLQVSRSTVDRVEVGERRLDVTELFVWADALGVAPETLVRRIRRELQE